jgi:hypothetical protein
METTQPTKKNFKIKVIQEVPQYEGMNTHTFIFDFPIDAHSGNIKEFTLKTNGEILIEHNYPYND